MIKIPSGLHAGSHQLGTGQGVGGGIEAGNHGQDLASSRRVHIEQLILGIESRP